MEGSGPLSHLVTRGTKGLMDDAAIVAAAEAWIEGDPEPATRAELEAVLAAARAGTPGATDELRARMTPPLLFGTAGLRARVGAGAARMNRATVIRTTRGVVDFLSGRSGARSLPVVVGHDARASSATFAADVVGVLAAARVPVRFFSDPVPTPLVAYVARAIAASAAIVVTASHNPREDNGYKLYLDDAVQLNAPFDAAIERAIERVGSAARVPRLEFDAFAATPPAYVAELEPLDVDAWFDRYLVDVLAELGPRPRARALRIADTPLHGVGYRFAKRALARAGHGDVRVVPEQAEPDGAFPTTPFPNPEEPATLALGLAFAAAEQAELLIANDPDADRLAVAVPTPSGRFERLTGNQLAALLADARIPDTTSAPAPGGPPWTPGSTLPRPLVLASVVTTPLVEAIALARGARFERTLTGFKWLWTAALALERAGGSRFTYACEEALGYSLTRAVRDKDGIAAAVAIADFAVRCRERGESLLDRLHALEVEFGVWVSASRSVPVSARPTEQAVSGVLDRAVGAAPKSLAGRAVLGVTDYRMGAEARTPWLPAAPLVELGLEGGRVLLRPSGTEPKLKFYVDLRGEAARGGVASAERALLAEAGAVASELVAHLGL
jgi:phosphomannomutase